MNQSMPFVITISRQLGSGGAYIGQQLAKRLNINFVDREIISEAAQQLSIMEEEVDEQDEKIQSFWKSFLHFNPLPSNETLIPKMIMPTAGELFKVESEIIERIAKENSAVIIGRCGYYVLRNHPNCVKVFLHADVDFRSQRIQHLYNMTEQKAREIIARNDKERAHYISLFTENKWTDIRQFDLSIDTGKTGVDESVELILGYLKLI